MSRTVESKVVEMKFDNSNFEKNVQTSLGTLSKLKDSLKMTESTKGFSTIGEAARNLDFSGLMMATETVSTKFSALEAIAVGALMRIGQRAVDTGIQMIKGMSTDQIAAGFEKLTSKNSNVQTLMNSTGKTMEEINGYLEQLMWYSDETSFGFTDMTSALSTMVSSGGDIEKLIPMIMGMGNATAYAGKGASEFQRVIYNLNQSYSQGFLSTMDWRSVEGAGAASIQLKKYLMEAAEELGDIKKGTADVSQWSSYLSGKQISSEAMEIAFKRFAEYTQAVKQAVDDGTYETATQAMEAMGEEGFGEVGVKAFKAAQQAKTFGDAIDATKDAVSSGWMSIWETIFGDFQQQTVLWTDFCNDLWDIFASGFEDRIDLLDSIMQNNPLMDAFNEAFNDVDTGALFTELNKVTNGELLKNFDLAGGEVVNFEAAMAKGLISTEDLTKAVKKLGEFSEDEQLQLQYVGKLINKNAVTNKDSIDNLNKAYKEGRVSAERYALAMSGIVESDYSKSFKSLKENLDAGRISQEAYNKECERLSDLMYVSANDIIKQNEALEEAAKLMDNIEFDEEGNAITGRTYLINVFANALHGLMAIMEVVKEAWANVFPPKSSTEIYLILQNLSHLSEKLIPTEEQLEKISTTFEGLFNALGIVKDALGVTFNLFKRLFGLIPKGDKSILDLAASFGLYLTNLRETIRENETFEKAADAIYDFAANKIPYAFDIVKTKFNDIKKGLLDFIANSRIIQGILKTFSNLKDGPSIFERMAPAIQKVGEVLSKIKGHISDFLNSFSKFEWIVTIFKKLYNILVNIFKAVGTVAWDAFSNFGQTIANALSNLNFSDSAQILGDVLGLGILGGIRKIVDNLKDLSSITEIADIFKEDLETIGDALGALTLDIQADALLKIGEAVALLAGSLILLSGVEPDALDRSVGALTVLMAEVGAMLMVLTNLGQEVNSPEGFFSAFSQAGTAQVAAKAMQGIAKSILILAAALYIISKIEPERLDSCLGVITALLAEMTLVAIALSEYSVQLGKGAKMLTKMASAVLILAIALKIVASVDPERLEDSMIAIIELITGLAFAMKIMSESKVGKGTALALIGMAAALLILSAAVFVLGSMKPETLTQGLIGVAFGLGMLTAAAAALGKVGKGGSMLAGAIAMIIMAGALLVLYEAVKLFGSLEIDVLEQGLLSVGVILMGFLVFSAGASKVVGGIIALSLGLLVFSAALLILVPSLLLMGNNASVIGVGLLTLAGALVIFLAAAFGAELVIPGIIALTLGLMGLSIACALLGVGLAAVGVGFMMLATMGAVGAAGVVAFLDVLITGVIGLIPVIISAILDGLSTILKRLIIFVPLVLKLVEVIIVGILDLLIAVVPKVLKLVGILLVGVILLIGVALKLILQLLINLIPDVVELVKVTIISICDALIELIPKFFEVISTFVTETLNYLVTMIPLVTESALLMIAGFLEGIAAGLPDVINAAFDVIIAFIDGVATALDEKGDDLNDAVWHLLTSLWDYAKKTIEGAWGKVKDAAQDLMDSGFIKGIKDKFTTLYNTAKDAIDEFIDGAKTKITNMGDAAKDIVDGLIKGVKDKFNEILDLGKELGEKMLNGIKGFLGINSPSKAMAEVGRYSDEGLIVGLKKYSSKVKDASEDVGETALNGMQNSINRGISKVFDDADGFNPVITPTLDLSQVSAGANSISSMFDANPIGVNGNLLQNGIEDNIAATIEQMGVTSKENVDAIVRAIKSAAGANVNVTLSGDANGIFKVVREQNNLYKKRTGISALG